ncbi:MAG: signal recognition particle protein [Candidatus Aureabacteria bacterium]|nr:signal recognition particle protein [Candidatus Auribacterota bacterium]
MFDTIANRFQQIFRSIRGWGRMSEENIAAALREIRIALLEADVHYRVVAEILKETEREAIGGTVASAITPGQQLIKVFHEKLVRFMTDPQPGVRLSGSPPVILLAGLQGSGKTTTAAKLAWRYKKQGQRPLLVAADVRRPAAAEQLKTLGDRVGVETFAGRGKSALTIARDALQYARLSGHTLVILDTAGRLHADQDLMVELGELKKEISPAAVLLTLDAMTGQDAVNVASAFDREVGIDGAVLTKLDGDARGGAAMSLRAVTGKPIKFVGAGERPEDLSEFDPGRMVSRILGMGDILTLVEKAQEVAREEAERSDAKGRRREFSLEDFRRQMTQFKRLGSLDSVIDLLPVSLRQSASGDGEARIKKMEAILDSMTREEKDRSEIIDGNRRLRIARGSGTTVTEVNQLLKQFQAARKMMAAVKAKAAKGGRRPFHLPGMPQE